MGEELRAVLRRCLQCLDIYFSSFEDDGVCLEGAGYFSYGFGFFTSFAELLERRSGGKIDLFDQEKKSESNCFVTAMVLYFWPAAVNFADSRENVKAAWGFRSIYTAKTGAEIPPVAEDILDD